MNKKILISILSIDRDANFIEKIYDPIKSHLSKQNIDLLIICREIDKQCQEKWKKICNKCIIKTIKNYSILGRYNMDKICEKRNIAKNHAKENNYDYLWFIDSDVIVNENSLEVMIKGCEQYNADVCTIPGFIKNWNHVAIGVFENNSYQIRTASQDTKQGIKYKEGGGWMGCTLIKNTVFHIPFIIVNYNNVIAEDRGFMISVHQNNFLCLYVENHPIIHL